METWPFFAILAIYCACQLLSLWAVDRAARKAEERRERCTCRRSYELFAELHADGCKFREAR